MNGPQAAGALIVSGSSSIVVSVDPPRICQQLSNARLSLRNDAPIPYVAASRNMIKHGQAVRFPCYTTALSLLYSARGSRNPPRRFYLSWQIQRKTG